MPLKRSNFWRRSPPNNYKEEKINEKFEPDSTSTL